MEGYAQAPPAPVQAPFSEGMRMMYGLSMPAFVAAVTLAVIAFLILLPGGKKTLVTSEDPETQAVLERASLGVRIFAFIVVVLFSALSVYIINCMMVGNCLVMSWIHTGVIVLCGFVAVMGFVYSHLTS